MGTYRLIGLGAMGCLVLALLCDCGVKKPPIAPDGTDPKPFARYEKKTRQTNRQRRPNSDEPSTDPQSESQETLDHESP